MTARGGQSARASDKKMTANGDNEGLRKRFIDGMSLVASTVGIVTTDGDAGRAGVTVSAMTSISADGDAPTMLVCVHHLSAAADAIIQNGRFCANLLRDDQSYISDIFAGRVKPAAADKFSCAEWEAMKSGGLRVKNPLAAFDCGVLDARRVGTHYLFIGEVREVFLSLFGRPLIYANRAYGSSVRIWQYPSDASRAAAYRIGGLDAFAPRLLPPLLRKLRDDAGIGEVEIYEGDQRYLLDLLRAGTIDFAFLCDFQLGDEVQVDAAAAFPPHVLLAADHPLAARPSVALGDLLDEPFVMLDAPPSADYFLSLFDGIGEPFIAYRAKSPEMVQGMVAQGLGYGLLPVNLPPFPRHGGGESVTRRPLSGVAPLGLALCRRRDAPTRPGDELFAGVCAELLRELQREQNGDGQSS